MQFKYGEHNIMKAQDKTPDCFGCSGSCNVNMACPVGEGWREEAAGVTRLLTAGGSSLCSGSMINNVEQDGRQLFLSADHCGGGVWLIYCVGRRLPAVASLSLLHDRRTSILERGWSAAADRSHGPLRRECGRLDPHVQFPDAGV